jgi:hypothetical protein
MNRINNAIPTSLGFADRESLFSSIYLDNMILQYYYRIRCVGEKQDTLIESGDFKR